MHNNGSKSDSDVVLAAADGGELKHTIDPIINDPIVMLLDLLESKAIITGAIA